MFENRRNGRIWAIGVLFSPGSSNARDLLSGEDLFRVHFSLPRSIHLLGSALQRMVGRGCLSHSLLLSRSLIQSLDFTLQFLL